MSFVTTGTFNPYTHKVVPKDAVVLDLKAANPSANPEILVENILKALRKGTAGCRGVADQIEAQTKPPRMAEPGPLGVVRDEQGEDWFRAGPNPYTSQEWVNTHTLQTSDWDDITGKLKLIRKGV